MRQRVEIISSLVEVENSSFSLGPNSSILREYVWTVDLMASAYLGHECVAKYSRDEQVASQLSFQTKTHRQDNGELMDDDKTRFAFYNRLTSVRLVLQTLRTISTPPPCFYFILTMTRERERTKVIITPAEFLRVNRRNYTH